MNVTVFSGDGDDQEVEDARCRVCGAVGQEAHTLEDCSRNPSNLSPIPLTEAPLDDAHQNPTYPSAGVVYNPNITKDS